MEDIVISLDRYDIISSGSVIIPPEEKISFSFKDLKFVFDFIEEKDDAGNLTSGHFTMNVVEEEGHPIYLKISLINQVKSFFSSTSSIIPVATLQGKQVFLKFAIVSINQKDEKEDKVFFYTWYRKKD